MKILVLGASGMAGHVVAEYLSQQGHEVTPLSGHRKVQANAIVMDLLQKNEFEKFLEAHTFDAVVNCSGILIKLSESRPDLATYLNSFLPHYLAHRFEGSKTRLVHISTDCVYSGKNGPYKEDAPYDGATMYDRSKALGEVKNDKDVTLRTSIVGPEIDTTGSGLFDWFYKQSGTIYGFDNAIWTGVTTIELAKGIEAAIENNLTGLYHFVPNKSISKLDLIRLFKEVFERDDITIEPKSTDPTNKTLINTRKDFSFAVADYRTMVQEMRVWIEGHPKLYPHYKLAKAI